MPFVLELYLLVWTCALIADTLTAVSRVERAESVYRQPVESCPGRSFLAVFVGNP